MTETINKPSKMEQYFIELREAGKTGFLAELNGLGDSKFMWSMDNPVEIEAARAQFAHLSAKGYRAHTVKADGSQGEVIREFDPDEEAIIMTPQSVGG